MEQASCLSPETSELNYLYRDRFEFWEAPLLFPTPLTLILVQPLSQTIIEERR
ncbi:MAG: hypothetical protein F6J96_34525 [Symploca sp. SIO1C2]|nr:hypothetical protein [Symploca sp. SIO1C2]